MSLSRLFYYNLNISNGSIIASHNSNTIGNIFTTAGNVGIGTTAPLFNLDINGTTRISGNVTIGSNLIVIGPTLQIPTGNIASRPITPQNGSIRYNSETQQFEGYGPGGAWGSLGGVIDIAQTTRILASATPSTTDGNLYFFTTGTERMRINSSGNIGIGTSAPSFNLDVNGTARISNNLIVPIGNIISRPSGQNGSIRYNTETQQFEGYGPGGAWGSLGGVIDIAQTTKVLASATPSTTDGNLYFITTGTERMRINSSGNIGIGTTLPSFNLDVAGTIRANTMISTNLTATNFTVSNVLANTINYGISSVFSGSFSASNNVSTPTNITGFNFSNSDIRSFRASVTISILRTSGGNLYENYVIEGFQFESGWSLYTERLGDDTGITFNITSQGQMQYTSTNLTNFISNIIRFSISQIANTGTYVFNSNVTQGTLLFDSIQIQNTKNSIIGTDPGSLYVLGGSTFQKGINILTTENAIGLGTGGGLSVLGGGSISKDLLVGGTITTGNLEIIGLTDTLNLTSTNITSGTLTLSTGLTSNLAQITNIMNTNLTVGTARITSNLFAVGNSNTIGSIFTTGGNVGIGTTVPNYLLEINGSARVNSEFFIGRGTTAVGVNLWDIPGAAWRISTGGYNLYIGNGTIGSTTNTRMIIGSSGNVGLNTENPSGNLDIWGGSGFDQTVSFRLYNNSSQYGRTQLQLVGRFEDSNDTWSSNGARNAIMFQQQNSKGSTISTKYVIQNFGEQLGILNGSGTPLTVWNNNGNVGIGTQNPSVPLHVNGSTTINVAGGYYMGNSFTPPAVYGTGNQPVTILSSGYIAAPLYLAYSDIRIKKNIKPVANALEKIKLLNIVSYDHIDFHKKSVEAGIVASEIKDIFPNMVNKNTNFIPNIYNRAEQTLCSNGNVLITVKCDHEDVKENAKVKLMIVYGEVEKQYETTIINLTNNSFEVVQWENYSANNKVFVYGTEVDDFLSVDKDQIGVLAAAGIKELQAKVEALEIRLAALEQK